MAKKRSKKNNQVEKNNEVTTNTEKVEVKNKKKHKKFDIKKNFGRLIALIMVICILLASSATLIFYVMWYMQ